MNKLTVIIGICIVAIVIAAIAMLVPLQEVNAPTQNGEPVVKAPTNFMECAAQGNPVAESYPRQCNTPSGAHFVEDIGNALDKVDLIQATSPQPNENISSPLMVGGEARGNWYFEASFPIEVQDANGKVIGQGYAQAQGEWTTEDFVPFESIEITFPAQPAGSMGKIILRKDNPSGLPEHDDYLEVPIVF